MSRVGKRVVTIPKGVDVNLKGKDLAVKGPKGALKYSLPAKIEAAVADGKLTVKRTEEGRETRANHGAVQAAIHNMIKGVSEGFQKTLEIKGVGFRAEVKGKVLQLSLGFSHPVLFPIPEGIQMKVANQTVVTVEGFDRGLVGQTSANLRGLKPPEPYQGKGIRYQGEVVRQKVGKAAAGAQGA